MTLQAVAFLCLHFYTFLLFLVYMSFHLYVTAQLTRLFDKTRTRSLYQREKRERLDNWVTAVHAVRRSAKRALSSNHRIDDANVDGNSSSSLNGAYGVKRVRHSRLAALGFRARVKSYQRVAPIVVPEVSPDSRRCDLWNERQDVSFLVKCRVTEGEAACFNCIESRKYKRVCVHLQQTLRLSLNANLSADSMDDDDNFIDIPANAEPAEGYCLPESFAQIAINEAGNYVPKDKTRNCNPNTGEWLLARMSVVGDTSYNWVCRCRYINLMTNLTTVFSDCMRPVGCLPNGILDKQSQAGRVNPYTKGNCVCNKGFTPDRDPAIGPICVPSHVVSDTSLPEDLYTLHKIRVNRTLSWPNDIDFLDPRMSLLAGNSKRVLRLPNPCCYDAATGRELSSSDSCKLVSTLNRRGDERIAYCIAQSRRAIPVRSDRDYLRGNNGRYANACLLLEPAQPVPSMNAEHSILSYQTSAFVSNAAPDFGLVFVESAQLQAIIDLMRDNEDWRRFMSNVIPPEPFEHRNLPLQNFQLLPPHTDVSKWFSVYEQSPAESRVLDGLRAQLMDKFRDKNGLWGYLYNLRVRKYYWYNVTNPLAGVNMNHGFASELNSLIDYLGGFRNPNVQKQKIAERVAFVHQPVCVRSQDFEYNEYAAQATYHHNPTYHPSLPFIIPFASGSGIHYESFSKLYFKSLLPIFTVAKDRPSELQNMPFVYNANYDQYDATLMIHKFPTIPPYSEDFYMLSAEYFAGQYKQHRVFMRGNLQSPWI